MSIFVVPARPSHFSQFFLSLKLHYIVVSCCRCRVVVVARLSNCRVPSSVQDNVNLPVQLMGTESDLDGDNINVVVRVRPLNQKEVKVRERCQGDNPIDRGQGYTPTDRGQGDAPIYRGQGGAPRD